ncbi:NADH dehydrogenase [ubiquinone] 1 beta subcomplex subunit 7-like [Liolophura sinensis]|uniref:NADH dehydrogenase [ubiquinone] 1 beta subcomplex subunit 7-like n=1 Tax=Liolophura sinensis TaxID=3198878 RepID=UPI0031582C71
MGNTIYAHITHRDTAPNNFEPPTFDPLYGFPNGRKERVMVATQEELEAASVPLERRDYCAHHYLEFMRCRQKKFPWIAGCKHEQHDYDNCQYNDYILRMKEYEREKRLKERAKRLKHRNQELLVE